MKRIISLTLLLTMILIICPLSFGSCSYKNDDQGVRYAIFRNYCQVVDCVPTGDSVVIENEYEGRPVTAIKAGAFKNAHNLKSIDLPKTVRTIEPGAFSGCDSLEKISVSAKSEYYYAKGLCLIDSEQNMLVAGFNKTVLPEDVIEKIGESAFAGCTEITELVIPDSVVSIGENAFENCKKLETVKLGNSLTHVGNGAFSDCISLKSILLPDSVVSIGENAFHNCISLEEIEIEGSLNFIYSSAFTNCTSLKKIDIPDSVLYIGDGAFARCTNLEAPKIPESTLIGENIFAGCSNIKTTKEHGFEYYGNEANPYQILFLAPRDKTGICTLPQQTRQIACGAFNRCSFTDIRLPLTLLSIGDLAFASSTTLENIVIPQCALIGTNIFENCTEIDFTKEGDIKYYGTEKNPYQILYSVTDRDEEEYEIQDGTTQIAGLAFERCDDLDEINLPDTVQSINFSAFNDCDDLSDIYFDGNPTILSGLLNNKPMLKIHFDDENEPSLIIKIGAALVILLVGSGVAFYVIILIRKRSKEKKKLQQADNSNT